MSVRQKLLLTTIGALVLSMTAVILVASQVARSSVEARVHDVELPAVLNAVAEGIANSLLVPMTVSRTIAANPRYQAFVAAGEPAAGIDDLAAYLAALKQEYDALSAFYVSAASNRYYTAEGLFKTVDPDSPRDDWFFDFLASGKTYELALDVHEVTGEAALFINYAVRPRGETLAVGGIGVALTDMTAMIREYRIGEGGGVFLVDPAGTVKLHRDREAIGTSLAERPGLDRGALLAEQGMGWQRVEDEAGQAQILAARFLPELGWYLVAELPAAELYGRIDRAAWLLAALGAAITLVAVALSYWLISSLTRPLVRVAAALEEIAGGGGDLTQRLDASRQDEIGRLAGGYNHFVASLNTLLLQVREASLALFGSIKSIDQQMANINRDVVEQQSQSDQAATAVQQMGHTVHEIAANATTAAEGAAQVDREAEQGRQSVERTLEQVEALRGQIQAAARVVEQLSEDTAAIDRVLEVIRGISEQTNLLALNAAIEAARAGPQGRGFAVVADEVRSLAQRSHQSTEEIRRMIEKLQKSADGTASAIRSGVSIAEQTQASAAESGDRLAEIAQAIKAMSDRNLQIATATEEQASAVEEVSGVITRIADIAGQNARYSKQAGRDCENLRGEAERLKELVAQFKLS